MDGWGGGGKEGAERSLGRLNDRQTGQYTNRLADGQADGQADSQVGVDRQEIDSPYRQVERLTARLAGQ